MPRIVGFVTGLYVEDWIGPAIDQALNFCDEVIVAIGANTPELAVLQDGTLEKAQSYGDRIKLVEPTMTKTIVAGKAPTLNNMLKASNAQVGDWIWLLDADEFYHEDTAEKVREIVNSDNDLAVVRMEAKFFFVNMTRYLLSSHNRLFKVTHEGVHFKPSQHWQGKGGSGCIRRNSNRLGMFHYSLLMSPRYRKLFWETEYNKGGAKVREAQRVKLTWLEQIYNNFDLSDEDHWLSENSKILDSGRWAEKGPTPTWNWSFTADPEGKLYHYSGAQPPVIEAANLHLIDDFREFKK